MKFSDLKSGLVGFGGGFLSSLCCLLPLTVILLGLGSGAFMVTTMQFRSVLLPIGLLGVGVGYFLYFREKRRCEALGCHMVGSKFNLVLLIVASLMLAIEVVFVVFPEALWSLMAEG